MKSVKVFLITILGVLLFYTSSYSAITIDTGDLGGNSNNQRKIVKDSLGNLHLVYIGMGGIKYTAPT